MCRLVIAAAACSALACSPGTLGDNSDDTWVGTITTEGNVTTVVNESGLLWGGPATLVEDLRIGVAEGEAPYMFGHISSVFATADEIYVADMSVPAVRDYAREGTYLRNIGRPGQGPGAYGEINAVSVLPDGRVVVRDFACRISTRSDRGRGGRNGNRRTALAGCMIELYIVHMKRVTASEARRNWFRLLDEVADGEILVVERKGRRLTLRREDPAADLTAADLPNYGSLLRGHDVDSADNWSWEWKGSGRDLVLVERDKG